jgi:hypothetical protein
MLTPDEPLPPLIPRRVLSFHVSLLLAEFDARAVTPG